MQQKIALLVVMIATVLACNDTEKDSNGTSETEMKSFESLVNNYYEDGLKLQPLNATSAGDDRYNDLFPNPLAPEQIEQMKNFYQSNKDALQKYDLKNLTQSEQMTHAILNWECDINLEHLSFKNDQYFPIDQMWSLNLIMGQLASGDGSQPFKTVEDYGNWISRLDGYIEWLETAESNLREGMTEGYVLPKSLIKKVIPQLEAMTEKDLEKHLFYGPIKKFPENFTQQQKDALVKTYSDKINNEIIPAYQKLVALMKGSYMDAGRTTSGITGIPNGANYYKHQIKKYTTTNMTAEEIHQLGLSEVARILSEMEQIKDSVGYKGDMKSFFNFVRENKELMPFTEPQMVIDNFNAIHERMKPQIEKLFDVKPKTPFEVRRTEAFREKSSSAEYNPGSVDGTRPGIFYVPIPDAAAYNVYGDESLFLHEAIPGHHYQISLSQESTNLPKFRKTLWYSGYGEGWALYSESLGKELGLYTDPYQYFGMLGAEMHRAIRLVVDTGLHAKGWTREQAIQYSLDNEAESEASIISEIERYMANPGQALSYKIGQLKIRELRAKAEKELGDQFDIGVFHNEVLETGCVPLALLEDKIDRWIASNK